MGRRSSYDESPPRRSSRRRSLSPRGGRGEPPTSLLVRNISRDIRPDDLRAPFERYGPIKDVYLPKNFYTGEPRGFGFVQFVDPRDAEEAQYKMNHQLIKGREVSVVFAEETRKKPSEMRMKEAFQREKSFRRSPPRRGRSRSRSPRYQSPRYSVSPRKRRYSRSYSPPERRGYERPLYPSPGRREYYGRGSSPPPYRRESYSHGREVMPHYPPFVAPAAAMGMFVPGHGGLVHPYPPYHHPGSTNRVWGDM